MAMIRGARYLLCMVCASVIPAAGLAQLAIPDAAATASPDADGHYIVVTGPNLEALDRYVAELTVAPHGDQLSRWNDAICPRAIGISPEQNSFLAGRIVSVARELDIPVRPGRCRTNILVVVTQEADAFARLLLKRYPKLFDAFGGDMAPARAVSGLMAPRPVRWLNGSEWGNADGAPVVDGNKNFIWSVSRLEETTRRNATLSLVIVDSTKLEGVKWGGLASYIAMVALARPSPEIEPKTGPTILALFRNRDEGRAGPVSLTRWDRAFLRNLYASKANASWSAQTSQIRRGMKREISSSSSELPGD